MKEYSFLNLLVLVNSTPLAGWAEGDDVLQVSRREDGFNDSVGADGRMLAYQNANKSGLMVFRLQQQSEGNAFLNYLYGLQEGAQGVFVPLNVTVKDLTNGESALGTAGYLKRPSDVTRGTGINAQEWNLVVERLDLLFGPLPGLAF